MVSIWRQVLGREQIGIGENFFEIGGHSLRASAMASAVSKELNVDVRIGDIFRTSTIKALSNLIQNKEISSYKLITPADEREYYPQSSAQKLLFIQNQMNPQDKTYNMPKGYFINGELDRNRFELAFKSLISRHESLRTSFHWMTGEPVQRIHQDVEFEIDYWQADLDGVGSIVSEFVRPFSLDQAPLLRVGLIRLSEQRHMMLYDLHHIIADGLSMEILEREFIEIYHGKVLEPLRLQYKDFSEWQRNVFLNEQVAKQERFWLNRFSSEIPKLALPTDYPRPSYKSYEGDQVGFILDEKTTMSLKQLSLETETTLYMVLLSAFTILLSKISGQEDIVVGTPVAGRTHVDLANIMGIMINNICMRNLVDKDKIFMEFLKEIRQNTIEAYDNQTFPFEMLVEKLGVTAEPSRSVLFDAMFGLNSNLYSNSEHDTSNIEFIPSAVGNGTPSII
ncbi:hypothetical protein D3H35_26990 [Cohnella faecalis]|uniref:Carrier domain-containing protein n=1 Tax=Cohnella faecalis TaxID=2315694 RepID=A0A398CI46_9BACL|nr:hypothetical protein D3H35_26990 [Cohnella faecalis]